VIVQRFGSVVLSARRGVGAILLVTAALTAWSAWG
jgi:hypothetical protein